MASFAFLEESLICKMTAVILLVLISTVPEEVALAQCPDCTGEIKRIDATGKCHSCFPCPECIEGYSTSSVPCGATIPYERDIHCVEIQQHPQKRSQTSHSIFVSGIVTSASQISATTANLVISATSSFVPVGSSIIQNRESKSTKDPNTENILPPLGRYSNNTTIYILCAVFLVILSVAIVFKLQKKNKGRSQSEETTADAPPSLPGPSLSGQSEQGDEACHIDLGTNHVVYRGAHSSEMGDKSLNTVSTLTHGTENNGSGRVEVVAQLPGTPSCIDETPRDLHQPTDKNTLYPDIVPCLVPASLVIQQPQNQFLSHELWPQSLVRNGTISMGVQTLGAVNWSVLTQEEKYSTKILHMPFQLLHRICLSLDILRTDGKDKRLLAEKLGLTISDFKLLQQAVITQSVFDPVTYVLLRERFSAAKPKGTVGDFVDILKAMEREDIVNEINGWSEC